MDAKVQEANVKEKDEVEKMKAALRALPDLARAAVLEGALDDLTIIPLLCPLVLPNATEQDIRAIMQRTQITATITPANGSVLNENENGVVNVTVRNCTTHDLRGAELFAGATQFATVVGPSVVALGDIPAGQARNATFQCRAIVQTPTQGGPPDPLINLSVRAVLDFRGFKLQPVLGEVVPS